MGGRWSHDFPNKSKMADGGHIEFRKMLIYPYWMKCTRFGTTVQHGADYGQLQDGF